MSDTEKAGRVETERVDLESEETTEDKEECSNVTNKFVNDGSFLEMFKRMQEQKGSANVADEDEEKGKGKKVTVETESTSNSNNSTTANSTNSTTATLIAPVRYFASTRSIHDNVLLAYCS